MTVHQQIKSLLEQRILILDGGMGTLIQVINWKKKIFVVRDLQIIPVM